MIEKLKTIDPYSQEELDMSAGSLGGLVYENTPLIQTVNQLVDAVNELQKRIDPPSVYEVMQEKDEIIARHIGKKNKLQKALDCAVSALETISAMAAPDSSIETYARCKRIEINAITKGDNNE